MAPTRAEYERLPRTDDDLEDGDEFEFKDKPLPSRRRRISFRRARRLAALICRPIYIALLLCVLFSVQILCNTSYHPSSAPPFTPNTQETVYIAANIIDGDLITGAWGKSLIQLVELIGHDRVFVSIYGGPTESLKQLASMLECPHALVSEEEHPLEMASIPRTTLPSGQTRIKRIAFLAEARNKALEPLNTLGKKFDKVLFLNDVFFAPEGALRLLWGTHVDQGTGKAEYKAACAADFVTSWKYYDTFATRDAEGYSLGVPIFPWFPNEGNAISRRDVLEQRDSVRVKSCWGGMVSFDGQFFQEKSSTLKQNAVVSNPRSTSLQLQLTFRSEPEPFWDSSECCLIHADIMAISASSETGAKTEDADVFDTGIYMNPYVRTAYSESTFRFLWLAQCFERLLSPIQRLVNPLVSLPRFNYRRAEKEGEVVADKEWVSYAVEGNSSSIDAHKWKEGEKDWKSEGFYKPIQRKAQRGGYCGVRQLLVLKEEGFGEEKNGEGGGNWDNLLGMVPPVDI